MRLAVRIFAAINACFQVFVGVVGLVNPAILASLLGLRGSSPGLFGVLRLLSAFMASTGAISGLLARRPSRDPGLSTTFASVLLLQVAAMIAVVSAEEIAAVPLAFAIVPEVALSAVLLFERRA